MTIMLGIISDFVSFESIHLVLIGSIGMISLVLAFYVKIDYKVISLIFFLALYINLIKPIFEIRFAPIFIDLAIALITIRMFLDKAISGKTSSISPEVEIPLLFFFLISIFQIFNPNVPTLQAGLEGFRKTTYQMLAIFIGIYYVRNILDVEKINKYFLYASVPILVYGIKQWFFWSTFDQKIIEQNFATFDVYNILGRARSVSIFSGPFHFGMFSCVLVLLSLYFYLKEKKFFHLFTFILSVMGVFFSMTRVNIVSFIFSISFFLWFAKQKKGKIKKLVPVFLFFFLILVIVLQPEFSIIINVVETLTNMREDQRFLYRFEGYENIIKAFIESPILGYGMGSAGDTLDVLYTWKFHFTSHNLGFKILIETGLIGLGIYIFFFLVWFKKAFYLFRIKTLYIKNLSVLITSIVLVLLVNGMVGSAIEAYPINLYIWFLMGALVKIWWLEIKTNMVISK
jgi:O-antigen ligase